MNIYVLSLWSCILRSRIASSYGDFTKSCQVRSEWLSPFAPRQQFLKALVSPSKFRVSLCFSQLRGMKWPPMCSGPACFLTNGMEHLLTCEGRFCVSPLEKCQFTSFSHFPNNWVVFLVELQKSFFLKNFTFLLLF